MFPSTLLLAVRNNSPFLPHHLPPHAHTAAPSPCVCVGGGFSLPSPTLHPHSSHPLHMGGLHCPQPMSARWPPSPCGGLHPLPPHHVHTAATFSVWGTSASLPPPHVHTAATLSMWGTSASPPHVHKAATFSLWGLQGFPGLSSFKEFCCTKEF